ncbi:MAG: SUMF1/EgtB/PvdO family nonheme iron enzyme [Bacillota bacterium]
MVAWYTDNSQKTQPVAQKAPNALGFYDMNGNVWEVINSYPWKSYFIGGSYSSSSSVLRAADMYTFGDPSVTIDGINIGFRLVRPN